MVFQALPASQEDDPANGDSETDLNDNDDAPSNAFMFEVPVDFGLIEKPAVLPDGAAIKGAFYLDVARTRVVSRHVLRVQAPRDQVQVRTILNGTTVRAHNSCNYPAITRAKSSRLLQTPEVKPAFGR